MVRKIKILFTLSQLSISTSYFEIWLNDGHKVNENVESKYDFSSSLLLLICVKGSSF
jgi:hypothetical protein